MENFRFSVWTATFNRASFLVRLYESLKKQIFKDFEWIIVDDGSNDNTKEIVDGFIAENSIKSIRYFKKKSWWQTYCLPYCNKLFSIKIYSYY